VPDHRNVQNTLLALPIMVKGNNNKVKLNYVEYERLTASGRRAFQPLVGGTWSSGGGAQVGTLFCLRGTGDLL